MSHRRISHTALRAVDVQAAAPHQRGVSGANSLDVDEHRARIRRAGAGVIDDGRMLNMPTTEKERAIEALKTLPERATIEDAIERLCLIAKIEEGLRQSEAGQLVSHDEVKKQFLS